MKNTKYLDLYHKWLKQGYIDGKSGLCKAFTENGLSYETIEYGLFLNDREAEQLNLLWRFSTLGKFNSFRQTIVLFLAALNDEL